MRSTRSQCNLNKNSSPQGWIIWESSVSPFFPGGPCMPNPCNNDGICSETTNSTSLHFCECSELYTGPNCEAEKIGNKTILDFSFWVTPTTFKNGYNYGEDWACSSFSWCKLVTQWVRACGHPSRKKGQKTSGEIPESRTAGLGTAYRTWIWHHSRKPHRTQYKPNRQARVEKKHFCSQHG